MSFAFPFFLKSDVKKKKDYVDHQRQHLPTGMSSARDQPYPTLASMVQSKSSPNPSPTSSSSSRSRPTSITTLPATTPPMPLEEEELDDNRFYRYMRSHFNQIFIRSYVVCIPHSRSLEGMVLTKDFIETHCYNPSPYYRGQYQAANGKVVAIEYPLISTVSGFKEARTIHIMAEEWVYVSSKKIRVFMVERPLEGELPQHYHNANIISIPTVRNSKTDLDFLNMFPENAEALVELQATVQEFVDTYVYIRGFNTYTVEKIQNIYVKAYKTILQENKLLRDACRIQSEHDHYLELVENVVMGFLHEKIWVQSLKTILQSQDNYLDSICRAYAKDTITLSRYAVSHPLGDMPLSYFEDTIACLRRVDSDTDIPIVTNDPQQQQHTGLRSLSQQQQSQPAFTPLEKIICIKTTLDLISAAVDKFLQDVTMGSSHHDASVTSDEMIPLLAYVITHSGITRTASLAFYMEHFRLSNMERSEHSFALVTLKTAIEFLKGDPLSLHDAGSAASVHSTNSSSSAIISPQIHSLRTRSTSFGSPISSPPPSSATQVSSAFSSPHYRSISISSQSMTTNHHHHHQHLTTPKTSSSHSLTSATMPSHPAFTRVLRHRKSQSADLHGMADSSPSLPPTIDDEFPQQERNRRNSLTPNVIVRPPIVLPSQRENRKSLDIPNDWMLPMKQSQTPPPSYSSSSSSSCVHYDPPSHFSPKLKHAAIGHTQPMVSTTFPSLSCSTPLPAAASDRTPESHKMSRLDEFPILVGETGMSESPKLARSLSSTSAIKKRSSALPQPPKVINIGERLSFDGARRPASICLDTRSLRNLRDDEQDQDMLGDFLRGLQNMDGDIVGERSGSFRTFRRL